MKNFRNLILTIATFLFISCGSFELTTRTSNYDMMYDYYNYNQIHYIYMNNPRWFYDNLYIDVYGRQRPYHLHPYFIKYKKQYVRRGRRNNHNVTFRTRSTTSRTYNVRNTHNTVRGSTKRVVRPSTTRSVNPRLSQIRRSTPQVRRNISRSVRKSTPRKTTTKRSIKRQ